VDTGDDLHGRVRAVAVVSTDPKRVAALTGNNLLAWHRCNKRF
jgi:hypothetical protein